MLEKPKENQCFWEASGLGSHGFEVSGPGQEPGPKGQGQALGPRVQGPRSGPRARAKGSGQAQGQVYVKLPINRTCGRYVIEDTEYQTIRRP